MKTSEGDNVGGVVGVYVLRSSNDLDTIATVRVVDAVTQVSIIRKFAWEHRAFFILKKFIN